MDLTRVDTIVQFTQGANTTWNNVNIPVPTGVVVIDTVNKIIKEGDGSTLFANLPVCLDYNFSASTSGAVTPEGDNVGAFAIADDSMYSPSNVKLSDILSSIVTFQGKEVTQQTSIDALNSGNVVLEVSEGVVDGTIVVCSNGKYGPGDKTLAQLISDLVASVGTDGAGMHIDDLVWYSDAGLTNPVVKPNELTENNTYWCKVTGFHDTAELKAVDFGLATTHPNVTVVTDAEEVTSGMIAAIYGGSSYDFFEAVTTDSNNNIICAGYTQSEGAGIEDALVIKFDTNLNILAKKRYGGSSYDYFQAVTTDSNNNIICAGHTYSEGAGNYDALVIKFDTNLNILAKKRYGGDNNDRFYAVTTDSNNNIICAGFTGSEGAVVEDALVIKFDTNLNILAKKRYGGGSYDQFQAVTTDSNNNIICAGNTQSEGAGISDALVIKFDTNLNTLAKKRYGGSNGDYFYAVTTDSNNNIICAGFTGSEGAVVEDALVIKFDTNLNILAKKRYGGSSNDQFQAVTTDSNNNIICAGHTYSEGAGNYDALVIKFDTNLNILAKKRYGGGSYDQFQAVTTDSNNNIICAGNTQSEGAGNYDALVIKLPETLPSGTVVGTVLTNLTLADSNLTLADSNLTFADSNLTLADSNLTFADSNLTLADSNLTLEKDILISARYKEAVKLITTIYTSADDDRFTATTIDAAGNIIAVGSTTISGAPNAIVTKFTSTFAPIARKLYVGNYSAFFNSVVTDASNNIICVGSYTTTSGGYTEAFITMFDTALASVIAHKTYGASGDDEFSDIMIDNAGKFIVVGYTTSEGSGLKDALVIKFNEDLSIASKKRYGGNGNDALLSVAQDSVGNTIAVGWTTSEGANTSGLVLKLDINLNIILRKIYNSTLGTTTEFSSVVVTAANVIYCCGRVVMATGNKGLVVKFDSNINVTGNKVYGSTLGNTEFTGIGKDSENNIICVGKTNAEGAGNYDALTVKFDQNLVLKGRKTYGSIGADADIDCSITADDDIVMSGYSVIQGSTDAVITKMPGGLPSGIYTNKYFVDLIMNDSKLGLSDDNALVSNSTLTMADSALTLTNGTMTLSNANGAVVSDTTIMDAVSNVFKVTLGNVTDSVPTPVTFNVVTDDGDAVVAKNISVDVVGTSMVAAIYGGSNNDQFQAVTTDSNNNIICAGITLSEGAGVEDALVVKFDTNLNILAKKRYGGSSYDYFYAVTTDSNNNIICAGFTQSEGAGISNALVIKFDTNLNILAKKRYGRDNNDRFYAVTTDSNNNIICAGHTRSEGAGNYDALVVKFDTNLSILAKKRYGGSNSDYFQAVTTDSNNNIICAGITLSEGAGSWDALVVKFDTNLNILAKKRYGGSSDDYFYAVTTDSNNNIICAGITQSEGAGSWDALVVKFDTNLNILAKKRYGGSSYDYFYAVTTDSNNNIICAGYTYSEGAGNNDALVIKFDTNLNILAKKRYGGSNNDYFEAVTTDSNNNIICAGFTGSEGAGGADTLVIKLPETLPSGTVVGTVLTNLTLADSNLTLADSNLTLADSNLTLADSNLTFADSNLTLADSNLTLEKDAIYI